MNLPRRTGALALLLVSCALQWGCNQSPLSGTHNPGLPIPFERIDYCWSQAASAPLQWRGKHCGRAAANQMPGSKTMAPRLYLHLRFLLPAGDFSGPALLFVRMTGSYEIYQDERLLMREGPVRNWTRRNRQALRPVLLPVRSSTGSASVIRLLMRPGVDTASRFPTGDVVFGSHASLLSAQLLSGLDRVAAGSAMLFLALLVLVASLLSEWTDVALLRYLGLFTGAMGAWSLSNARVLDLLLPYGEVLRHTELYAFFLIIFSLTGFIQQAYTPHYSRILTIMKTVSLAYALGATAVGITGLLPLNKTLSAYQAGMLIAIPTWVALTLRLALQRHRLAMIILIGSSLMATAGVRDVLVSMGVLGPSAPMVHWSALIFVACLGIGAAFRVAESQRRQESAEARAEALAALNHELRTSLTVLVGAAEMIEDAREVDPEYVSMIRITAHRLGILVDNALDFSRLEAGALEPRTEPVPVAELLEETIRLSGVRNSEGKNTVSWHRAPDVPEALVTDRLYVERILLNLIHNADKFTRNGSIQVRIDRGERDGEIRFAVHDTGSGISADFLGELFKPFHSSRVQPSGRGTGLGLSICRMLVEKLGGSIAVESVPGRGSTFTFTITSGSA